ncbi:hypothetical protein KTT_23950 [Tengunoibacter tsumagoiensis]|uniref:FAD dependent oxidoreductase domain-containing protein n=1 Tax=Tengunoibacter tsumagoiensis TaxID=2014871 RepID=A0A402A0F3_9CHLR|nr:hypothetical protein KTT_23950 [Tengunoibacter tsumagoiensis]
MTLVERHFPAYGATGRNGGFVAIGPDEAYTQAIARLGYTTAQAILHVTLENQNLLRQVLEEETIQCHYREPGHLQVVGWSMSGHCDEKLVERALDQALARRRPPSGAVASQ